MDNRYKVFVVFVLFLCCCFVVVVFFALLPCASFNMCDICFQLPYRYESIHIIRVMRFKCCSRTFLFFVFFFASDKSLKETSTSVNIIKFALENVFHTKAHGFIHEKTKCHLIGSIDVINHSIIRLKFLSNHIGDIFAKRIMVNAVNRYRIQQGNAHPNGTCSQFSIHALNA